MSTARISWQAPWGGVGQGFAFGTGHRRVVSGSTVCGA